MKYLERRVAGRMAVVVLWFVATASGLYAQESQMHSLHHGVMPPGAIGSWQLQRGGPLPGFFQPVEIKAPSGVLVSLASSGRFDVPEDAPRRVGMLIGEVYRLRVMNVPLHAGVEVFPTIEVVDRLYPPVGEEHRFSIPVELTQQDLGLAMEGKFVTRVIYLEDPNRALPAREDPNEQTWLDVAPGRDPLTTADEFGRPVAILRLGGRMPQNAEMPDARFLYGCPPYTDFREPAAGAIVEDIDAATLPVDTTPAATLPAVASDAMPTPVDSEPKLIELPPPNRSPKPSEP